MKSIREAIRGIGRTAPNGAGNPNHSLHDAMRSDEVRVYGHRGTIHNTERVDVEVNGAGECVAVWFRCQQLPFKQSFADGKRSSEMRYGSQKGLPRLVAVEVID